MQKKFSIEIQSKGIFQNHSVDHRCIFHGRQVSDERWGRNFGFAGYWTRVCTKTTGEFEMLGPLATGLGFAPKPLVATRPKFQPLTPRPSPAVHGILHLWSVEWFWNKLLLEIHCARGAWTHVLILCIVLLNISPHVKPKRLLNDGWSRPCFHAPILLLVCHRQSP